MNLKVHFKKVKGRFYMSLGFKGYRTNSLLDEALSEWIGGNERWVTFTDERTENSVYKANIHKKEDHYIVDLYDIDSGELQWSYGQCPKLFQDYNITPEFYINYSPEW